MHSLLTHFILIIIASSCKDLLVNCCNVFPKDLYIEEGSDTQIVCQSCVPGKISWWLNGKKIEETQHQYLSHTINSSHTVLSLMKFTKRNAIVQCRSNAREEILGGTHINTYTKPGKISCIFHHDKKATVPQLFTCNWEHQINPSKETNYTVLGAARSDPQFEICNSHVTTCTTVYTSFHHNISLSDIFTVTVRAKSADFEAYSETQEFTSLHIWKIFPPELELTTHPDGVLVNCAMPDFRFDDYLCQVRYCEVISERTPEQVICRAENFTNKEEMIYNLNSCSTYKFAARCALIKAPWSDWGLEKSVVTKLTMTDIKLRLWRKVTEPLKDGFRKVHAMWTGIPSTCQETFTYAIKQIPFKQHMTGVNYTETICGNTTCEVELNRDAHRITLTVLKNDALPLKESVYVPAIAEDLPQVTDIQASNDKGIFRVSWKAPDKPVSGYMIDYTHDGNKFNWMETNHTSVTLIDLLDYTPYNITVTPLLDGKTGHGTQALQICSRFRDPGNVTIVKVQAYDRSAFVSWDVKTKKECSGAVVSYTVFYYTNEGPKLNATIDGTRHYITLQDLTPVTRYNFYVQATAVTGSTQSSMGQFTTKRFDPRLVTALLVCGSIAMVLVLFLGLCCAVLWKRFKEKPVPDPGHSTVAKWSLPSHQQETCSNPPFSNPCESYDRVYPEEPGRTSNPPLPSGCNSNSASDPVEEYTVPDVVPAPDTQNNNQAEPVDALTQSSTESTALLVSKNSRSSPYRSQSSVEGPAQKTGKQSKRVAVKQQEKPTTATVYVTLDMLNQGEGQTRRIETRP